MKPTETEIYIVTETACESKNILQTWVCLTEEKAKACLKKRYEIACSFCQIGGIENPTDCLEYGFFFWKMDNEMKVKYQIETSQIYDE